MTLDQGPSPSSASTFLVTYPRVLQAVLGRLGDDEDNIGRIRPDFDGVCTGLSVGGYWLSGDVWEWHHFLFCPTSGPLFEHGTLTGAVAYGGFGGRRHEGARADDRYGRLDCAFNNAGLSILAEAIVWMCPSKAPFMTGQNIVIDGGYTSR